VPLVSGAADSFQFQTGVVRSVHGSDAGIMAR
jgi:hypothetical protein